MHIVYIIIYYILLYLYIVHGLRIRKFALKRLGRDAATVIFEKNIYYLFFLLHRPVFLSREVCLRLVPPRRFRVKQSKKNKKIQTLSRLLAPPTRGQPSGTIMFVLTSLLCIHIIYNIIYSRPPRSVVIMYRWPV